MSAPDRICELCRCLNGHLDRCPEGLRLWELANPEVPEPEPETEEQTGDIITEIMAHFVTIYGAHEKGIYTR